jgi:CRISPR-associated protein Cmr3
MIIELNPLDTLFFRDGKPFAMGEETWADGIFPPPPSVIYGALRTAWFANNIEEFVRLKINNKLDDEKVDLTTTSTKRLSSFRWGR